MLHHIMVKVMLFQRLGREPEAVECYSKALELNPLHYQSYYVLGKFFSNRGRYKEAIEYYNKGYRIKSRRCRHIL